MGPKIHRNVQKCAKPFQTSSTLNRNCQRAIWRGPLCKTNLRVRPSNLSWKFQSWSCSNPTWFVHLRYCYDMELWTRRILLPVFHRPPLEVHALLVDRLQPQILIIEFAKTALPGAAPSPIYGFKPHVSSQNVGHMYCWLSNHPRHYCTYYLFCLSLLITQNLLWVWTYIIIPIITIHEIHYSRHPHIILWGS